MLVPKQRHNKSRGRRRRAGHPVLKAKSFVSCKNCGKPISAHQVCSYCGSYKGREVVDTIKSVKKSKVASK